MAYGQVSVGTTATLIAASRIGRKSITVFSGDSNMFFGDSAVTASTGFAREGSDNYNIALEYEGALYAIMASGSGTCSFIEIY